MDECGESIWKAEMVPMSVAKTNLSKIVARVNETGEPVLVSKGHRPWFVIRPLAYRGPGASRESGDAKRF